MINRKKLLRKLFPRGLRFTREGKVYILVTLGVGFGAMNTGNNLLFLVFGLLLGLIVVSGILSEITIRKIGITRKLPPRAQVGVPFPVELALKNLKRYATSFGVELKDEIDQKPFRRRCFFLRVGAGEERAIAYRCELSVRGLRRLNGTMVSTRFPFGLFEKRRFVAIEDEIIAVPAHVDLDIPVAMATSGIGGLSVQRKGSGQEFLQLREMTPEDDARRIDWRATARHGKPFVRETQADAHGFIEVVLDASQKGDDKKAIEQAEKNICAAATVVREAIVRGLNVRLVTPLSRPMEATDPAGAGLLLDHLALIDIDEAGRADPPVGQNTSSVLIGPRAATRGEAMRLRIG